MIEYVRQTCSFALGNFINLTPALRWLSAQYNTPVKVFFETRYVRDCFLMCPFIEVLKTEPENAALFSTAITNEHDDRPDYQHIFNVLTGAPWQPKFHTYVDMPPSSVEGSVMLVNGSGSQNPRYVARKDPGPEPYEHALRVVAGRAPIVSCGSPDDAQRAPYMTRLCDIGCWNNIRSTLSLMVGARCIIANDTGLAHAAGAMNKPLLVLWKDTPRERCKNAGTLTEYAYENHTDAIDLFLEKWM